jgi:hypothetical protein
VAATRREAVVGGICLNSLNDEQLRANGGRNHFAGCKITEENPSTGYNLRIRTIVFFYLDDVRNILVVDCSTNFYNLDDARINSNLGCDVDSLNPNKNHNNCTFSVSAFNVDSFNPDDIRNVLDPDCSIDFLNCNNGSGASNLSSDNLGFDLDVLNHSRRSYASSSDDDLGTTDLDDEPDDDFRPISRSRYKVSSG